MKTLVENIQSRLLETTTITSGEARGMDEKSFNALSRAKLEELAKAIKRPSAEWTRTVFPNTSFSSYFDGKYPEKYTMTGTHSIVLSNGEINIIFGLYSARYKDYQQMDKITANRNQDDYHHELAAARGRVEFLVAGKWYTYDRRGIDDSFSISRYSNYPNVSDVSKAIKDQIKRVAESKERLLNSVTLPAPLASFNKTAKEIEAITATLKAGKDYRFNPAGMGTGYIVTKRKLSGYEGARATAELNKFFGVDDLYIGRYDAD